MPVHVKVDLTRLKAKLSSENIIRARKAMATQAMQEMNQYVPSSSKGEHENGTTLRGETNIADDGSYVLYNVPYAKAQFYGFITNQYGGPYRIHNYTTPGTSRRWDLRMKSNQKAMDDVQKAFIRGLLWQKCN
ncbi:minor capsid protein [Lactobacillus amylovorus]|uniref:Minor capsid protein n=1 Tax=Lactobacillus amylovorus TaxID=1604 RepID=A0A9X3W5L9_LACAM|nr:minor capsid protein [Lactobacillus amylovorus]MDB6258001.1 minor capsid protein [Lactobacillus amylovorus]